MEKGHTILSARELMGGLYWAIPQDCVNTRNEDTHRCERGDLLIRTRRGLRRGEGLGEIEREGGRTSTLMLWNRKHGAGHI